MLIGEYTKKLGGETALAQALPFTWIKILHILISNRYQVHTGQVLPIPIPIFLTYKGSLCRGEQCVMTYEVNHQHVLMTSSVFLLCRK